MSNQQLVDAAINVRSHAHAPYSRFAVGAALLTRSGKVFVGCNVENVSLRLTLCAEQGAVSAAVASGERDFVAMAVVADSTEPVVPCGGCRQMLAEFNPDLEVITSTPNGRVEKYGLNELLPRPKQGILESFRND
ncbi:MAG: cytidine deaminase [Verrucomicrobiales bacterium]|nr:cytidine deaminase [Verrucomicrobiales bacterium]